MNSLSGFFLTIILLGAVQGFIVSSLLFFSKKNKQSDRLLAVLLLLISLACFNLYANYKNWFGSDLLRFIGDLVPLIVIMPVGPLIFFYVKSLLDPSFKITKKQRVHFYPVVVDIVPQVAALVFVVGVVSGWIQNNPGKEWRWGNFVDTYDVYSDIPRWISVTVYVWLSAKYLSAIKKKYNGSLNGLAVNFRWLQQFIRVFLVFQCIWFVYLVPYVIPRFTDYMLTTFDWYPLYIPLAIIIYWLGIKGYVISQQDSAGKKPPATILSPEIIHQTVAALKKSMEQDKLFLNSSLTLHIAAEQTGINPKIVSAVLNQHLHKSFNEFVNEYRIEAFKEKILQADINQFTIAGIAFESGFNSQATFQRTFKQITGMSPSEFRNTAMPVNLSRSF